VAMLSSEYTALDKTLHKSFLKKPKYASLHLHWTRGNDFSLLDLDEGTPSKNSLILWVENKMMTGSLGRGLRFEPVVLRG